MAAATSPSDAGAKILSVGRFSVGERGQVKRALKEGNAGYTIHTSIQHSFNMFRVYTPECNNRDSGRTMHPAQAIKPQGRAVSHFGGGGKDMTEQNIVRARTAGQDGFARRVDRYACEERTRQPRPQSIGAQPVRRKMDAVSPGGERDIRSAVDNDATLRVLREADSQLRQLQEMPVVQILLPDLNEVHSPADGPAQRPRQGIACERQLFTVCYVVVERAFTWESTFCSSCGSGQLLESR